MRSNDFIGVVYHTLLWKYIVAGPTGLEPAASCVTGMRSNQLSYGPHNLLSKKNNYKNTLKYASVQWY
jgi:hypothetical protein